MTYEENLCLVCNHNLEAHDERDKTHCRGNGCGCIMEFKQIQEQIKWKAILLSVAKELLGNKIVL